MKHLMNSSKWIIQSVRYGVTSSTTVIVGVLVALEANICRGSKEH
jgi:hypothetical protein